MSGGLFVVLLLAVLVLIIIAKTAVVVPQQSAYVVERLGKYAATLDAGFHILLPFIDRIRYKHSLKETAIDIPEQVCITRDNVQVSVDGILYLKVLNPQRASYGISDYNFALIQLAPDHVAERDRQDRTGSDVRGTDQYQYPGGERTRQGLGSLGRQSPPVRDQEHHSPKGVLDAMEKQMRAERKKRAVILHVRRRARRGDQPGRG